MSPSRFTSGKDVNDFARYEIGGGRHLLTDCQEMSPDPNGAKLRPVFRVKHREC